MAQPTPAQVAAYNNFLIYAVQQNPGPLPAGIAIGPVPGTNYCGNGVNDLANKAYALAMTNGLTTVNGVAVSEFIIPNDYNSRMETAMQSLVNGYETQIGSNLANDVLHMMPENALDTACQK